LTLGFGTTNCETINGKEINLKFENVVARQGYTFFFWASVILSHHPAREAVDFCSVMYFGINRIGFTEVYIEKFLIQ